MSKSFRVLLFGKAGCKKCALLNDRLDRVLADPQWADFEKLYCDAETEEGLVALCDAECIDPQRLPALLVLRKCEATEEYQPIPNPNCATRPPDSCRLYSYLGLQTDYSETGRGVITTEMITGLLAEARKLKRMPHDQSESDSTPSEQLVGRE